jgi:predicted nucleic acid-binding protein
VGKAHLVTAIELDHPAYDCLYLALAVENDCRFVTADERLVNKIRRDKKSSFRDRIVGLAESLSRKT